MSRIISVHEYILKPSVSGHSFESAVRRAEARGLFDLPGLVDHYLLRGIKGERRGDYAAVWVYESREAWETLWGPPEAPVAPDAYPGNWIIWEEVLSHLLLHTPNEITFTVYETI